MTHPLLMVDDDTGYNLTRSLRFRASASAYLSRTPAGAGNQKIWTYSAWVKRGVLGTTYAELFGITRAASDADFLILTFGSNNVVDTIGFQGWSTVYRVTTQVCRDPSAWYHIVLTVDTTQATAANRIRLYLNGIEVTSFSTSSNPAQNANLLINSASAHTIGRDNQQGKSFDGYMAEMNFIDGQALTPSSFGEFDPVITTWWKPKKYTGTYGTNGFYLDFKDNSALTTSSNVGLGKDVSGNGNYWTTNNISITAGVTYDSMTDVPTLTSATAANFAVLNPLMPSSGSYGTLTDGNLKLTSPAAQRYALASISMEGKFYAEFVPNNVASGTGSFVGINEISIAGKYYATNGQFYNGSAWIAYGATYTSSDVIGVAVNTTAQTIEFFKNNVSQGVKTGLSAGSANFFLSADSGGVTWVANFGQRPFTYTPPSGFVALNAYNLPDSTIKQGNKVMDATVFTATGTTQSIVNAASFKPDLVWTKSRSAATNHALNNSVRGAANYLVSNTTGAEGSAPNFLTSFDSNGFTMGTANYPASQSIVGLQWQAGQGVTNSNTSGTVTATTSVNASAGFSIASFNAGASGAKTFGHGLGVAPAFGFIKSLTSAVDWIVYHQSAITNVNTYLVLDTINAPVTAAGIWGATLPTSSVIGFGSGVACAANDNMLAAFWSEIAGYSKFGSYIGNGSADGVFVYLGFRPKFLLLKRSDSAEHWYMLDSSRNPYNQGADYLMADVINAEASGVYYDFLSNGFKLRNSGSYDNASGGTYIYAAFAENPFKNSLAR